MNHACKCRACEEEYEDAKLSTCTFYKVAIAALIIYRLYGDNHDVYVARTTKRQRESGDIRTHIATYILRVQFLISSRGYTEVEAYRVSGSASPFVAVECY